MKKIIGLSVVFLLILAVAVGGTISYFADTETSTANTITAGTLDLGLANSTGQTPNGGATQTWSTPSNWKPNDTNPATLYLYNGGSVAISSITVEFEYTSVTNGTPTSVYGYDGTADTDKLDKMIKATTATFNGSTVSDIQGKTLEQLKAANAISLGAGLTSLQEKPLAITWTFDSTATNGCQGDSITFIVTVIGNQN
jgi:spore coat-associated protein N